MTTESAAGTTTDSADIIDFLADLDPTSEVSGPVARLRHNRTQARDNAQASFRALFEPEAPGDFTLAERYAVAAFVAGLHGGATAAARATSLYTDLLVDELDGNATETETNALITTLAAVVSDARAHVNAAGVPTPYGVYREPDLADESVPGPEFHLLEAQKKVLGPRLAAALEFTHLLVLHPRDSRAERLQPLADAGWSPTEVVRLAQLVAFLTFQ
ncbi:MAG: CMD domain protein, partial [Corynebacterium variabile]